MAAYFIYQTRVAKNSRSRTGSLQMETADWGSVPKDEQTSYSCSLLGVSCCDERIVDLCHHIELALPKQTYGDLQYVPILMGVSCQA